MLENVLINKRNISSEINYSQFQKNIDEVISIDDSEKFTNKVDIVSSQLKSD